MRSGRATCPRRLAASGLFALALLLVGCGGSSPAVGGIAAESPQQIVAAAKGAVASAESVHVKGSVISEGKPISLDMELLAHKGARGRIKLEGLSIDIVQLEGAFYLNGSAAFYRHLAGTAAAQLLQGKWLKAPSSSGDFAPLAQLTSISTLLGAALASHGTLASAGTASVNGHRAVGVRDASKGGVLYVAATGTPYPLEIEKGSGEAGRITFDRWDQPLTIAAPAGAINITQLQNGH